MIDTFGFGSMVIDGKPYDSDLMIYPDGRIEDGWRRQSGHRINADDIRGLIESKPEIIIVGTGIHGLMTPDERLSRTMREQNIRMIAEKNDIAVQRFNQMSLEKRIGACFHLTC